MNRIVETSIVLDTKYENLPIEFIIDEINKCIRSSGLFTPLKISIGEGAIITKFYKS